MSCKGTCNRFKTKTFNGRRYVNGQKRCTGCDVFLTCEGFRCPCCNRILRKKSKCNRRSHADFSRM